MKVAILERLEPTHPSGRDRGTLVLEARRHPTGFALHWAQEEERWVHPFSFLVYKFVSESESKEFAWKRIKEEEEKR